MYCVTLNIYFRKTRLLMISANSPRPTHSFIAYCGDIFSPVEYNICGKVSNLEERIGFNLVVLCVIRQLNKNVQSLLEKICFSSLFTGFADTPNLTLCMNLT